MQNIRGEKSTGINVVFTYIIFLSIYFIIGSILFNHYKYQINPDAVEYISIAIKYSNGEFWNAVNGYRSPLLSVLLIPFLQLPLEPVFILKILNLIIGAGCLAALIHISKKTNPDSVTHILFLISLIPIILLFVFSITTPDILSALFIILAFNLITGGRMKLKNAILLGIIIAFAYFAKQYNLAFLIILIFVISVFKVIINRRDHKKIIMFFIISVGTAIVLAAPWFILLSIKYGNFTIGTAGIWSLKFTGPGIQENARMISTHLHPINSPTGFVLDDFSILTGDLKYNFDINYYISIIIKNLTDYFQSIDRFNITIFYIFFIIFYNRTGYIESFKKYIFLILYIAGYSIIVFQYRYINGLVLIVFYMIASDLWKVKDFFLKRKNIHLYYLMIFIVCISFTFHSMSFFRSTYNSYTGREYYELAEQVEDMDISGNIAASSKGRSIMYITYYNRDKLRYFGTTKIEQELIDYDIDYYFVYREDLADIKKMEIYKTVPVVTVGDYTLYGVK